MSAAAAVLPYVWAFAQVVQNIQVAQDVDVQEPLPAALPEPRFRRPAHLLRRDIAFYRKFTQALLHRYLRMCMEAGKVPSLMGQEVLRGHASSYRVDGFDDVVIFLHDVDRCLDQLDPRQQKLVRRIAIEQYTVGETAVELRVDPRTIIRQYAWALDRLTVIFLRAKMLEPQKCCQGV
jgi:DNA-directed RNA polymerase specialized sigma24 family protein